MSIYSVNLREAYKLLKLAVSSNVVPHLSSSPGIGKSSIVKKLAKEANLVLIDYRASTGLPEEQNGLPFRNGNVSEFLPFANIFPIKGISTIVPGSNGYLLFLDEINAAPRQMMAALYRLILDRQVGQLDLHPDVYIITAGNRMSDKAITNSFGTAMQSRLVHIDVVSDTKVWLEDVAFVNNYDHRIISFISAYPTKLNDFNPEHTESTFCCSRTWEFMNNIVSQFEPNEEIPDWTTPLFAGTISSGVAAEFVQFIKVFKYISKYEDIIKNPYDIDIPNASTLQWATICSLAQNMKEEDLQQVIEYVNRYPLTFKLVFARTIIGKNPNIRKNKDWVKLLSSIQKYLNE